MVEARKYLRQETDDDPFGLLKGKRSSSSRQNRKYAFADITPAKQDKRGPGEARMVKDDDWTEIERERAR